MDKINYKSIFLILFFIFFTILVLSFVSADVTNCWEYSGYNDGTQTSCEAQGCLWTTSATDPWCGDSTGCCMDNGCWQYDGNHEDCISTTDGLNCTWDAYQSYYYPNGSMLYGMCFTDYTSTNQTWGGVSEGCWQYDADYDLCTSATNAQTCSWSPNDANQNPWCWIQTLFDAQTENINAISEDIGCCEQKGCWSYDGNETLCTNNQAFMGFCTWVAKDDDTYCPDATGCCYTKFCGEVGDEGNCTKLATDLYMPCEWDGTICKETSGGGFSFFNDTDSCMDKGGWYDFDGTCQMPSGDFESGASGYMFAEEAHCWFADNQPSVCKNITGCIYCNDTHSNFNVEGSEDILAAPADVVTNLGGSSGTGNESSACYGHSVGLCQGHEGAWINSGAAVSVYDISSSSES